MKNIIKGSHDTMTYLRAEKWWARPFRCLWQTQRRTLSEQIERGARIVDLRVVRRKDGCWKFAHGIVDLDSVGGLFAALDEIVRHRGMIVRLILERSDYDDVEFKMICEKVERLYPEITFIGGWRKKKPWKMLYDFKGNAIYPEGEIHQHCGSMAEGAKWYERLMPRKWFMRCGHPAGKEGLNLYDFF